MSQIFTHLNNLTDTRLAKSLFETIDNIENEVVYEIIYAKDQLRKQKLELLRGRKFLRIIVISHPLNYEYFSAEIAGTEVVKISEEEIASIDFSNTNIAALFTHSLVIFSNNNFARIGGQRMCDIFNRTPSTIYAVHDFDNHHWHSLSIHLALFADIYVPAHLADLSVASRVNSNILLGVPCGSLQWSAKFVAEKLPDLPSLVRDEKPLGLHSFYERFKYRNSILATVSQQYSTVGLLNKDYFGQTPLQRWEEWAAHSVHWIAPVFNDLPIRFFDALLTGGIPIVPLGLRPYLEYLNVPPDFYCFYSPSEVLDARLVVDRANSQFKNQGPIGVRNRSEFCLRGYHVDKNIERIKSWAESVYCNEGRESRSLSPVS
jgi:hypothetical protein